VVRYVVEPEPGEPRVATAVTMHTNNSNTVYELRRIRPGALVHVMVAGIGTDGKPGIWSDVLSMTTGATLRLVFSSAHPDGGFLGEQSCHRLTGDGPTWVLI
jgi:hypothetical protein